jgi:hypothetical protein
MSAQLLKTMGECRFPPEAKVYGAIDCKGWYFWLRSRKVVFFTDQGVLFCNEDSHRFFTLDYIRSTTPGVKYQSEVRGRVPVSWLELWFDDSKVMSSGEFARINDVVAVLGNIKVFLESAS